MEVLEPNLENCRIREIAALEPSSQATGCVSYRIVSFTTCNHSSRTLPATRRSFDCQILRCSILYHCCAPIASRVMFRVCYYRMANIVDKVRDVHVTRATYRNSAVANRCLFECRSRRFGHVCEHQQRYNKRSINGKKIIQGVFLDGQVGMLI